MENKEKQEFEIKLYGKLSAIHYYSRTAKQAALEFIKDFLEHESGEYNLESGIRAELDFDTVYITSVYLKDGKELWYSYESEYQEYKGESPASSFEVHHEDVADELVKTYKNVQKDKL